MKHPQLKADERTVLGKKIKKLRREGILPANIYGKGLKSTAVQVSMKEFTELFDEVGETGLVDVTLDGKARPSLIKNVHMNYHTHMPLHADFYQVNLKEKVKTMVPLTIVGEANAVTEKIGLMIQPLNEVEVEALPEELPETIEINVEPLAAIDEQITVGDLTAPAGVTILTDPTQTIVKIAELVVEEPEEEVAAEGEEIAETDTGEATENEAGEEKPEGNEESKNEEKSE